MTALKTKILFCDALPVYEKLHQQGLSLRHASVVTRSFAMAQHIKKNCIYIDANLSTDQRQLFKLGIPDIERRLIEQLNCSEVQPSVKNIFLQLSNSFQSDILDALLLQTVFDPDCEMTLAVPKTDQANIDEVLRPSWIDWLTGWDGLEIINVHVPYHNERAPRGDVETSLIDRLTLNGYQAVFWKIAQQKWLPKLFFKPEKIGVVGQTELARDGVIDCFVHGYKPVFLQKPKSVSAQIEPDIKLARAVIGACHSVIEERLSLISNGFLRRRAEQILTDRLATEFGKYKFFLTAWRQKLAAYPDLNCILSGYGKGPDTMALASVCKERGIKIAAFQHGITREILSNAEERRVFFETSFCDVFFAMNPVAAEVTEGHSLQQPVTVIAKSWPSPFNRVATKPAKATKPVLFVSTNLYSGHKPNGVPPMNDGDLFDLEMGLVNRVLGGLDLEIDYKPYPAIRQLDPDPVLRAVNEQKNMSVVGTHQELRYLLRQYRLFITTKATSTVSWIVATGKPLLFIDHYCHARLSESARDAFSHSFFLFDQRDVDFESRLKTFLKRPFDEILEEWDSKSLQRFQTIEQFFGGEQKSHRNQIFNDIKNHCLNI
jgi:hypothetical protein